MIPSSLALMSSAWKSAVKALKSGDMAKLAVVIDDNPEVLTEVTHQGETLLHVATYTFRPDGVRFLLRRGADPNVRTYMRDTPLTMLMELGLVDEIELTEDGLIQVFWDCPRVDFNAVSRHLVHPLVTILHLDHQVLRKLSVLRPERIKDFDNPSCIHFLASRLAYVRDEDFPRKLEVIREHLPDLAEKIDKKRVDMEALTNRSLDASVLVAAIENNELEVVRRCVEAHPRLVREELKDGMSALQLAVACSTPEIFRFLISQPEADVNAWDNDDGLPLLFLIVQMETEPEKLKDLLAHPGLDLTVQAPAGVTVLSHLAVRRKTHEHLKVLLKHAPHEAIHRMMTVSDPSPVEICLDKHHIYAEALQDFLRICPKVDPRWYAKLGPSEKAWELCIKKAEHEIEAGEQRRKERDAENGE